MDTTSTRGPFEEAAGSEMPMNRQINTGLAYVCRNAGDPYESIRLDNMKMTATRLFLPTCPVNIWRKQLQRRPDLTQQEKTWKYTVFGKSVEKVIRFSRNLYEYHHAFNLSSIRSWWTTVRQETSDSVARSVFLSNPMLFLGWAEMDN